MQEPSKEEINACVEQREKTFVAEENQNPNINTEEWLQRYLFTDLHENFFCEFPIIFYEWIAIITQKNKCFKATPTIWNVVSVNCLKSVSNSISRAVDYWFDSIIGGYITEFAVDIVKSYSAAEREFFKGPRGQYLKSLKLWTKILLCEKGVLRMESFE